MINNGMFNPLVQTMMLREFLDSPDISAEIKQQIFAATAVKYRDMHSDTTARHVQPCNTDEVTKSVQYIRIADFGSDVVICPNPTINRGRTRTD